jgi:signal transduction histidine kinase
MSDLFSAPAARQTVTMRARLAAAGRTHGPADPAQQPPAAGAGEPASARVAQARSRAGERRYRQRQMLRPLGWAFIAVVVVAGLNSHPAAGLTGIRLAITAAIAVYVGAAAVGLTPGWGERGLAAQAVVIGLVGAGGVALAALQPHGAAGLAASLGVWIAAVRLPARPAAAAGGAITVALAVTIALTQHPAAQSVIAAVLLCLLLAVTGRFIRRGRESQDQAEFLLAELQDAREGEAAAVALAERSRISGELHDVLAHALSGLAIQLQGARKLAEAEPVSPGLRAAIGRSADLAREGLADARQAVGALRGDRLPTVGELGALVEDFRRDTGTSVSLLTEGTARQLPADAELALYRGAQEALTNIVRYAPGATATVTVRYAPDRTILTVQDTRPPGRCAENGSAAGGGVLAGAGGGHGLTAMRERAARAGGTAQAGPVPGGWLVEVEIPA